ncbi:MAG: DUF4395 domain-containing protein [Dermatophilaceae bacterium]
MSHVLDRLPAVPALVDEVTVRLVAAVILLVSLTALLTHQWWLYAVLAADFTLRALGGPRWSPIARAVLAWVRPRVTVAPRSTAFAPKQFAAGIGAVMTVAAAVLLVLGVDAGSLRAPTAVTVIGALMVIFPALEAGLGFCVGCRIFAVLVRAGVVREDVCIDCVRPPSAPTSSPSTVSEDDHHAHRAG